MLDKTQIENSVLDDSEKQQYKLFIDEPKIRLSSALSLDAIFTRCIEYGLEPNDKSNLVLFKKVVGQYEVNEPDVQYGSNRHTWYVEFPDNFWKTISKYRDNKFRGQLFTWFDKLTENPVLPHGDTIKPLKKELAGHWRLRIGDFRIIYFPDEKTKTISLISCSPRKDAYE